jgi:hypothetical protein
LNHFRHYLNVFGTWVTLLDPSDVPAGMSPALSDVEFFPGGVADTRGTRVAIFDLLARGLDDAHAWLPPPIAKRFGRRLEALGWLRDDAWTPYCFRLGEKH